MTVYEIITEKIVSMLKDGVIPWRKPWSGSELTPRNAVSKRPYRGINRFLLAASPYASPFWLTYKNAEALGGNVRKGEKSTVVVFWKRSTFVKENEAGEDEERSSIILRYYRVFNIEQCDLPQAFLDKLPKPETREHEPVSEAQAIVDAMPQRPEMTTGTAAFYRPSSDTVTLPALGSFDKPEDFYATAYHELGHSTGHKSRLGRKGVMERTIMGSGDYSREELVAEMTAAFLCAESGISPAVIENQASYVQSWLKVLKDDGKAVVIAAAQAQKAADFILNRKPEDCEQAE